MAVIYLIIRGFTRAIREDQTIPCTYVRIYTRTHARTNARTHTRTPTSTRGGLASAHVRKRRAHAYTVARLKFRVRAFTSSISSFVLHGRLNVELLILLARGTSKTTVRSTAGCLNKGTFAVYPPSCARPSFVALAGLPSFSIHASLSLGRGYRRRRYLRNPDDNGSRRPAAPNSARQSYESYVWNSTNETIVMR